MTKELDVSKKAKETGFTVPVTIDPALAEQLQPNPYLASLGITFEQRIINLLQLVHAHLKTGMNDEPAEEHTTIPFMVLEGPLVREAMLSVMVIVEKGTDGHLAITLTNIRDSDRNIYRFEW